MKSKIIISPEAKWQIHHDVDEKVSKDIGYLISAGVNSTAYILRTGGIILSIEEALKMAEEIQQIAEIYFGQFREYKKVDLELTRKRRKKAAPRKKGKS